MATVSFVSSATVVTSAVAIFSDPAIGFRSYSQHGFAIRVTPAGITASKATAFGGTQNPITWPMSLDDARELATSLLALT